MQEEPPLAATELNPRESATTSKCQEKAKWSFLTFRPKPTALYTSFVILRQRIEMTFLGMFKRLQSLFERI